MLRHVLPPGQVRTVFTQLTLCFNYSTDLRAGVALWGQELSPSISHCLSQCKSPGDVH